MRGLFSTSEVAEKDRFSYWSDLVCDVFVGLDCRSPMRRRFNAEMRYDALDWLQVVEAESDEIEGVRSERQIAKDREDDLLVSVQLRGTTDLLQDGRKALLRPGEFAIYDSQRPYVLRMSGGTQLICLQFPRQELAARLGAVSPYVASEMHGKSGVAGLFFELARSLPQRLPEIETNAARCVAGHVLDLLAFAVSNRRNCTPDLSSHRAAMLARLKRTIRDHAWRPDFGPSEAAARAGISTRHANRLLALEDTSLERSILFERLARCASVLSDRDRDNLMIGEIAYSSGFNDLSHFSRSFRLRYGLSPREFRANSRNAQNAQSGDTSLR